MIYCFGTFQGVSSVEETRQVMNWMDADKENEKQILEMQRIYNASLGWDTVFQELEESKSASKKSYSFHWRKIGNNRSLAASLLYRRMAGGMECDETPGNAEISWSGMCSGTGRTASALDTD